jgi:hypothetical protein
MNALREYKKGRVEKPGEFRFYLGGRGYFWYEEGDSRLQIITDAPGITDGETGVIFLNDDLLRKWEGKGKAVLIDATKRKAIRHNVIEALRFLGLRHRIVED